MVEKQRKPRGRNRTDAERAAEYNARIEIAETLLAVRIAEKAEFVGRIKAKSDALMNSIS
jgi:hypothetical protein